VPNANEVQRQVDERSADPLGVVRKQYLGELSAHVGRNVIAYYSAFLTAPDVREVQVMDDDKNGFMNAIHGMDAGIGLDLILHTPGGDIAAAQSIVNYLHAKFTPAGLRVIVPQIAMSAGTMIACSARSIVMGRQSNLGPIDPQVNGLSAFNVIEEFDAAKKELSADPSTATYWHIVLQRYPPNFYYVCRQAIDWSNDFVRRMLESVMFDGLPDARAKATRVVQELGNPSYSKTHNNHLHIDDARRCGLAIEALEPDQRFQDLVLTVHHCYMHLFGNSDVIKIVENQHGTHFAKRFPGGQ